MNIIVFSKDRALQLELFIRSFNKYVKNFNNYTINIIYTYSNSQFEAGYNKLILMNYTNVKFIKEGDFKKDVINCIDKNKKAYSIFR